MRQTRNERQNDDSDVRGDDGQASRGTSGHVVTLEPESGATHATADAEFDPYRGHLPDTRRRYATSPPLSVFAGCHAPLNFQ
jgi:hypothetical protein